MENGLLDDLEGDADAAGKRLSDWFWRPWYARLWWTAAGVFWIAAFLVSWLIPSLLVPDRDLASFLLVMAFHPFTIIPALGVPLLFSWRKNVVFPWDEMPEDTHELGPVDGLYEGESIGFHRPTSRSFLHDPADIRSPQNPVNPAHPWWRHRH